MPKKKSGEEQVVEFFDSADLGKLETVFNCVKAIMKRRMSEKPRAAVATTPRAKGKAAAVAAGEEVKAPE